MLKKLMVLSLTLVLVLSLSLAVGAQDKEPIKIGFYNPLTGPSAVSGKALLHGAEIAVEEINESGGIDGHPLEIVSRDDKSDPTSGVNAFQELIQRENVVSVIGSLHSNVIMASMDLSEQYKVPLIGCNWKTEASTKGNEYFFRATGYDGLAASTLATFAVEKLDWEDIAIIHENDSFGTGGKDDFVSALTYWDMEPLTVETFTRGDKDFSGQISSVLDKDPDGIVMWGLYMEEAHLIKQIRDLGYEGVVLAPNSILHRQYMEIAGDKGNNVICPTPWSFESDDPAITNVLERHEEKYGEPARHDTISRGYDAARLIGYAMKNSDFDPANPNSEASRVAIKDGIKDISGLELMGGTYDFKKSPYKTTGEGLHDLDLLEYIDGKEVLLSDVYEVEAGAVEAAIRAYFE